jgi:FkbM family methyltransferase
MDHVLDRARSPVSRDAIMTVFDVGCRFGIHPTWRSQKNQSFFRYFAFDPDGEEVRRLANKYCRFENYFAFAIGFSDKPEQRRLNVLAHKGQSSFLRPNSASTWFAEHRKADASITEQIDCELIPMDQFCEEHDVWPDFIKTDTEGFDLNVLQGGVRALATALAVRCEVYFEEHFVGGPEFDSIYRFLSNAGFSLANLDYSGKGVPQSYFCPNPGRYGIYTAGEAVFVRKLSMLHALAEPAVLKLVLFGFLNNLEDLSFKLLIEHREHRGLATAHESPFWTEIKRQYLLAAKSLRDMPGDGYARAAGDFETIFSEPFPSGHLFFESDFLNPP